MSGANPQELGRDVQHELGDGVVGAVGAPLEVRLAILVNLVIRDATMLRSASARGGEGAAVRR